MKFLYARVSSNDGSQHIDRQTTEMENMMMYLLIMHQVARPIVQSSKKC